MARTLESYAVDYKFSFETSGSPPPHHTPTPATFFYSADHATPTSLKMYNPFFVVVVSLSMPASSKLTSIPVEELAEVVSLLLKSNFVPFTFSAKICTLSCYACPVKRHSLVTVCVWSSFFFLFLFLTAWLLDFLLSVFVLELLTAVHVTKRFWRYS